MLITDVSLYLPISERLLASVLDDQQSPETVIDKFAIPQIAALIVLQYLPRFKQQQSVPPARVLAEAIETINAQVASQGWATFLASALRVLDRLKIREGYALLPELGIALLEDDVLKKRDCLTVEGNWDSTFTERHRRRLIESLESVRSHTGELRILTAEQSKIFRTIKAQADDHLHVQGYAGTGKSSLIKSLLTLFLSTNAKILVLAERQKQLDALMAEIGVVENVYPRTFGKLLHDMVPPDLTNPVNVYLRQMKYSSAVISDEYIVKHLGIQSSGEFSQNQIVRAVRGTVARFCYSEESSVDAKHVPEWCASTFDAVTKCVVLHYASQLWAELLSREFQPLIRTYHRIKWAALNGWKIPDWYTHVLIDECHDLAKPMLQIFDSSPQAVISLGDEYQNLRGEARQRSTNVQQREVTQSVRSGCLIEELVNPIIAVHPGKTKALFQGNRFKKTEILYYDKPQIPEWPAVVLVSDIWGLFEWTQRFAAEDVGFELLSNAQGLDMFVKDCIELYQHGTRPRHGELFRFLSWKDVGNRYYQNDGFQRIDRMLGKKYGIADWARASAKFSEQTSSRYALGLIEDARNREFENVMLVRDAGAVLGAERVNFATVASAMYVAITRAQNRLIVPRYLRNWIEEISARGQ